MGMKLFYAGQPAANKKRFGIELLILLLLVGCQQPGMGADRPSLLADKVAAEAELSRQLKINKDALLEGSSEQIRIDAATVMLLSEESLARKVLLDVLRDSDNTAARAAICRALKAVKQPIKDKEDFIDPLLEILTSDDDTEAKLAAEATLIFEYEQISKLLEKMVADSSLPTKTRLNTIYALKLQPDMRAIFVLMDTLGCSEAVVAAEAGQALRSLGIPIAEDSKARKQIVDELKRKGKEQFLRDWRIRQEEQMRKLQKELAWWKNQYLLALDKIYDAIADDSAKAKFLEEQLAASEPLVVLWALEKVERWRVGTKSKLPTELGPVLVDLISHQDRDVRLKTAKLLSLMGQLSSAERLLKQLEVEQDSEVRMELFVALGGACYYAFSPNSGLKISPEIKLRTLELAAEYLYEQDPEKVRKGAEVIRKLLEQNGLTSAQVDKYLGLLAKRYSQQKDTADGLLRGELLGAMAGLCAQSVYKTDSARFFGPLFEQALRDETDLARQAAVDGLIYIDKAKALEILRDFINDSSTVVRKKVITLTGEVGTGQDLVWLAAKIGTTPESDTAWQAMLKIFKGSDAAVLSEWMNRFDTANNKAGLTDEQLVSFLEIAERKAVAEDKTQMLKKTRKDLGEFYLGRRNYKRAAEYFGLLREVAETIEEKEAASADLLYVYMKWPKIDAMTQLMSNILLEQDLDPNNIFVLSIDHYLFNPSDSSDPNDILQALIEITPPEPRPMWAEQLKSWAERLGQAKKSAETEENQ